MELDEFTRQYLVTALWSTNDESTPSGGVPLDESYGVENFTQDALENAKTACKAFQAMWGSLIDAADCRRHDETSNRSHAGHDFWLTRNGHGAGFWDGDWSQPMIDFSEYIPEAVKPVIEGLFHEYNEKNKVLTVGDVLSYTSKSFGEVNITVGDDGNLHFF